MSNYAGRPPHGGAKITHHELCLGDCGHWDCMGCCYCPEDYDVECVKRMTATTDVGWLGWWFSDQIAQAEGVRAIYEVPTGVWDEQSFDAGVKAARDAVEAVQAERGYDTAINWSEIGNEYAEGWTDLLSLILAAIDALRGGS